MARGQLLEFRSTEISVEEDFPAGRGMTGKELVSLVKRGRERSFRVCRGALTEQRVTAGAGRAPVLRVLEPVAVQVPGELPPPASAPALRPLTVMGIGSWPRPRWM